MTTTKSRQMSPSSNLEWGLWQKIQKIHLAWPDPNTGSGCHNCPMCPWHLKCSVPLALFKVKCPWHLECSVPLALSLFSLHSCQCPVKWVLVSPLFLGFQPILGMIWEHPIWLWGSSWSPNSPWEWSGSWLHRHSVPCCWLGRVLLPSYGVWWYGALPDVSLLATLPMLYVYCSSFLERNWFSYDFLCQLLAGQHVLADGDVDVSLVEGG